jgi:hypothetical protein
MRPIVLAMLGLAATCAGPAWGLDINGNTIGMTIDQVAKRYGKRWTCDTATDARAGDKICKKSPAVDEFPRLQNEYFAGSHVAIAYRFHDDRLVQIRVSGLAKDRFDGVRDTLTKAYGEPKLEKGSAQDMSGKSFEQTNARWESEGAVLDLSSNVPKSSAVNLSLYDAAYWKTDGATPKADGG